MLETVGVLLGVVVVLGPIALVIHKAGYSPVWILLAFVPIVNIAALVYFALSEWPIEHQLKQARDSKLSSDVTAETAWELKQLANRVTLLGQLAVSDEKAKKTLEATGNSVFEYSAQTLSSLEKFIESASNRDDRQAALALFETAKRECELLR